MKQLTETVYLATTHHTKHSTLYINSQQEKFHFQCTVRISFGIYKIAFSIYLSGKRNATSECDFFNNTATTQNFIQRANNQKNKLACTRFQANSHYSCACA